MYVKEEDPEKQLGSISITEFGIEMYVNEEQPENSRNQLL
jgi:hypothetical protein